MSDTKTVFRELRERRGLHLADIIAIRGKGLISRLILTAEGPGSRASHIAALISVNPPLIQEATHPRVRVRPLGDLLADAEDAYLISDKTLTDEQREKIVETMVTFSALPYSYWLIILHAFNTAFATTWFTDSLGKLAGNRRNDFSQITSGQAIPDKKPAAYWFRGSILMLLPILVPLYLAGHLRLILNNLLGSSIFALLEGSLLVFIGAHCISSYVVHLRWLRTVLSLWWLAWVVFLELNAMVN